MAFSVPTYATIRDRMLADCDATMAADGSTRGPVEYAVISAVAGAFLLLYMTIALVARNNVPTKAEAWLMRLWAAFFGVTPKPQTKNVGTAIFPATGGATLAAGWPVRLRSGVEFTTDAEATESGGFITANITAVLYGPAGRSLADTPIFLGAPAAGVTTQGVSGDIALGADAESNASLLARLIDRLRDPPKGGTDADFRRWVKATPGVDVVSVWVSNSTVDPNLGPASVKTLFIVRPTSLNSYSPVPTEIEVAAVQAYVAPFAPVDVLTYEARAVIGQELDPSIQLDPNDADTRAAVTDALRASLLTNASPGGGALISQINEAISGAAGEVDHVLVSPASNVSAATAETIIVLGTPNYSAL